MATTTETPPSLTVGYCLAMASKLCDAGDMQEWFEDLHAARVAYHEAEMWLDRASMIRGTFGEDGPARLDARVEIERRLGII